MGIRERLVLCGLQVEVITWQFCFRIELELSENGMFSLMKE